MIKLKDVLFEGAEDSMTKHLKQRKWEWVGSDRDGSEYESPDGKYTVRITSWGSWDGKERHHDSWKFGGSGLADLKSTFK